MSNDTPTITIDHSTETIISFTGVTKLPCMRCDGKQISPATVYRWASEGVKGIRLECFVQGGRLVTSVEAVNRFIARVSAQRTQLTAPVAPPMPTLESLKPTAKRRGASSPALSA